jgi:hypothetical protein
VLAFWVVPHLALLALAKLLEINVMAVIPMYQKNVAQTTEVGGAMASTDAPVMKAVARLGGAIAQVGGQLNERIKKEETEAQLAAYYSDRKKRANAINQTISAMSDPDEIERTYEEWRSEEDRIFSESKLSKEARRMAQNNNQGFYADTDIGAGKVHTKARIQGMVNTYQDLIAMAESGESHTLEDGTVLGPKELHEYAWRKIEGLDASVDREKVNKEVGAFDEKAEKRVLQRDMMTNPSETIAKINAQMSGKGNAYPHSSPEQLRSAKAYANQILTENRNATQDSIYKSNSEYSQMLPDDKVAWLQDKFDNGELTRTAFLSEKKRVMEPSFADATPKDNRDFLNLKARVYGARGNDAEMAKVLDDVTASSMPMEYRKMIFDEARKVEDPNSAFNQSSSKVGRELITSHFKTVKDDFATEAMPAWFGIRGIPGFTEELREDLLLRAEAEAQLEFSNWLMTSKDVPTQAEVSAKAYSILGDVNKRYTLEELPERIAEFDEAEEQAPPPETERESLDPSQMEESDIIAKIMEVNEDYTEEDARAFAIEKGYIK